MLRALALLGVLIVTPAMGQEGPSFDCSKAERSAEELICEDATLAALDRRVAERYAAALEVVRGLDAGSEDAEETLRAEQRGWIKGRDECWKADSLQDCVTSSYLRREGALVAEWLLQEPTSIAFWACDGNPANKVVTYFFDTELPSVRVERDDTIDAASLVPTGSGARYEGSFGQSIWIKGETATYREPDPNGGSYDCVLSRQE